MGCGTVWVVGGPLSNGDELETCSICFSSHSCAVFTIGRLHATILLHVCVSIFCRDILVKCTHDHAHVHV